MVARVVAEFAPQVRDVDADDRCATRGGGDGLDSWSRSTAPGRRASATSRPSPGVGRERPPAPRQVYR
jgi:hypothetical protein